MAGKSFPFELSEIEYNLTANKGIAAAFQTYGKHIWTKMAEPPKTTGDVLRAAKEVGDGGALEKERKKMEW